MFIGIIMSLYIQRLNFLLQTSAIALVYMETRASMFLKDSSENDSSRLKKQFSEV